MDTQPNLQRHLDNAYAKWQDGAQFGALNRRQFANAVTSTERKALILSWFDYQVFNGGVTQWIDNGYAVDTGVDLLDLLVIMDTEISRELEAKLRVLYSHIDFNRKRDGSFCDYWLEELEDEDDYDRHPGIKCAEELTDWYYTKAKQFQQEIEDFIVISEA